MGLTGFTDLEIAKHIIKGNQWYGLATSEKRICIYFRPSRPTRLDITTEEVLQIDCHVSARQYYVANQIQMQVKKLLHNHETTSRVFYFDGQTGGLPSMPGFVCVGGRYYFYAII